MITEPTKAEMLYCADAGFLPPVLEALLANSTDLLYVKDAQGRYVAASASFLRELGVSGKKLLGRREEEVLTDEALLQQHREVEDRLLAGEDDTLEQIELLSGGTGEDRYALTSRRVLRSSGGDAIGLLGIVRDVTLSYRVRQHQQRELSYLFQLPADAYSVLFVDIDQWQIISQRRQLIDDSTMEASTTLEQLIERALDALETKDCEAAEFFKNFSAESLRRLYAGGKRNLSFTYQRRLPHGPVRWVCSEVRFLVDPASGRLCAILIVRDIHDKKLAELDLVTSATLDTMTRLLNRETTERFIEKTLTNEPEGRHALFMLDVDDLKAVNEIHGHQAGDELLTDLAQAIRSCFRESDIVGRVGGDEFFALMKNIPEGDVTERKAEKLMAAVQSVCKAYEEIGLSGSVGISFYPSDGTTLGELYARADTALTQAKRRGKAQFAFAGK